jgi:hypothetical protein
VWAGKTSYCCRALSRSTRWFNPAANELASEQPVDAGGVGGERRFAEKRASVATRISNAVVASEQLPACGRETESSTSFTMKDLIDRNMIRAGFRNYLERRSGASLVVGMDTADLPGEKSVPKWLFLPCKTTLVTKL